MNPSRTLCSDFIYQAEETWEIIKQSHLKKLNIGEETLTDLNLLRLQVLHPTEIKTQKFTKFAEKRQAADWEWWLGQNNYWLGLRVQAKKLDTNLLRYKYLNKKTTRSVRQIDLLINKASALQPPRIPMYVFYNYWNQTQFTPTWLCQTYPKKIEMLGCGVSEANSVKLLLNSGHDDIQTLSSVMLPWSCLVCCHGFSGNDSRLPFRAFKFLTKAFQLSQERNERITYDGEKYITRNPPEYVYRILEEDEISEKEWREIDLRTITVVYLNN